MSCYLLGIDAGTQSTRAALFDEYGNKAGSVETEHRILYHADGRVEHSPADLWEALVKSVTGVLEQTGIDRRKLRGIAVDGTCSTTLFCDGEGNPYLDAIVWMDTRAKEEVEEIARSHHPVLAYSGGGDAVEWLVPKALWAKRHLPDIYRKSARIVESANWLNYKLTGRWTASRCNSTVAWNYSSVDGGFDRAFFEEIGLGDILEKWPREVQPMGALCGRVNREAAGILGIPEGIPVGQGGVDSHAAMVGMGVTEAGVIAMSLGSSSVHLALTEQPVGIPGLWGPYPEAVYGGTWLLQGGQSSTGSVVKWFRDHLCGAGPDGERPSYRELDAFAAQLSPGCQGLVTLENFQGNRSPYRNPSATGVFRGLTLAHTKYHIYRSILEAAAFGTRLITDLLTEGGVELKEVRICGGGAKSSLWTQIHADVCNLPFVTMREQESAVLGSAACAAVASGVFADLKEAAGRMTKKASVILPDTRVHELYEESFKRYKATYLGLDGRQD